MNKPFLKALDPRLEDIEEEKKKFEYILLIFVRIATFVFAAPFFSQKGVPNTVKIGLSVFIAYVMYTFIQPHVYPEYSSVLGYSVIVVKEVAVGLFLGTGAQLCTSIVLFAGNIIDMDIGLSMATEFNPEMKTQTTITGNLYYYLISVQISMFH